MIVQNGLPPHTMRCLKCGLSWEPAPAKSGPNKGRHTEASLDRATHEHRCNPAAGPTPTEETEKVTIPAELFDRLIRTVNACTCAGPTPTPTDKEQLHAVRADEREQIVWELEQMKPHIPPPDDPDHRPLSIARSTLDGAIREIAAAVTPEVGQ